MYQVSERLPDPDTMLIINAIDDASGRQYGGAAMYGQDGKWYWTFDRARTDIIPYRVYEWRYMDRT